MSVLSSSSDLSGSGAAVPSAYATQANRGKALLPGVMVTHHWANLFSHTVAAIAADALNECFYGSLLWRLRTAKQMQQLIEELRTRGLLEEVYWLCALSVNQHCSICGSFSSAQPEIDTVLCTPYPVCNCNAKKFVHGPSSEMNKFSDMMVHTKAEKADFRQVVVVDRSFGIFMRAWCVAELVEASSLGMNQCLKIFDSESLEAHRVELESLDISKCQASVQADKDYIMSRIPDVSEFNWRLRKMLLNEEQGLIAQWANQAEAIAKRIAAVASAWDELSPSYIASLEATTNGFRKKATLMATLPVLVGIGLFACLPLGKADGGWKENCMFLFLFLPANSLALGLFWPTLCTTLHPNIDRTRQIIVRELVWSCMYTVVKTVTVAGVSIGFDVFPVPLGAWVGCAAVFMLLPFLSIVFPSKCRNEVGFRSHFFAALGTIAFYYIIFGFLYPALNAWYLTASTEGQALIVLIFLGSRMLFELLGVVMSKQIGADPLPRIVFCSLTAYEWQTGIMLTRASHWLISAELIFINVLENAYFLLNLPNRPSDDGCDFRKYMRILVVLLARELAEAFASVQYLATLVCIYSFHPDGNEITRGMNAQTFTEKIAFVGIDALLECISLFVTCAILVAKGWAPVRILRGFMALHGEMSIKVQVLACMWFLSIQFVPFGNDLTFQFEWLK